MPAPKNVLLLTGLASGRFVDLVSTRYRVPYLTRHRLNDIDTRARTNWLRFIELADKRMRVFTTSGQAG
jgi:hypothetical protein